MMKSRLKWGSSGPVTLLLGMACIASMIFQGITQTSTIHVGIIALVTAGLVIVLAIDMWIQHQFAETIPKHIAILTLASYTILVEFITLAEGLTYTVILYLIIPFPAFLMLGRQAGYLISGGVMMWITAKFFIFKPYWLSDTTAVNSFTLLGVSMALIIAIAYVVQQERSSRQQTEKLLIDLRDSHQQLSHYAQQVAELATLEERNRLARDIHDTLGHYLTVIGIQLEKATTIQHENPTETAISIQNAKRMTDQALTDVRQSVSSLRKNTIPFRLSTKLQELQANLHDLSFSVNIALHGDENGYNPQQLLTLYRTIQEGITNVQKHAHANHVDVDIHLTPQSASLTIRDDGIGIQQPPRLGYGLQGIQERLALINSSLTLETIPTGGTQLKIQLPKENLLPIYTGAT